MPVITTYRYRKVLYDVITGLLLQEQPNGSSLYKSIAYPFEQGIVVSNDDQAVCVCNSARSFRSPRAFTLREVRASLVTGPDNGPLILDVRCDNVSLFSTLLRIDADETTSTTASIPAVLSKTDIPNDALLDIDILEAGQNSAAAGLKVFFIGTHQI